MRLKRFLEMRGADGGSWRAICALPALWVGLLYDSTSLDAAAALVADWTSEERERLRADVPKLGLKTPFRGGTVLDLAREVVALAGAGLARRARLNWDGVDETRYLRPLEQIVATGRTLAEEKLQRFERDWHGDIDQLYREEAF